MIRKLSTALFLATLATAALAQSGSDYLLGSGVKVALGPDWTKQVVPSPVMNRGSNAELLDDAKEIRMKKGNTGILISLMTWKVSQARRLDSLDPVAMSKEVATQYLPSAIETDTVAVARLNGDVRVSIVTLTAKAGEQFKVRQGYPGGCVSTGVIRNGLSVMAVSIASDSCQSDTHQAALDALLLAHE